MFAKKDYISEVLLLILVNELYFCHLAVHELWELYWQASPRTVASQFAQLDGFGGDGRRRGPKVGEQAGSSGGGGQGSSRTKADSVQSLRIPVSQVI